MEALVVACAALVALVLIDAGYRIAVSLMRWSPVLIVGAAARRCVHRTHWRVACLRNVTGAEPS